MKKKIIATVIAVTAVVALLVYYKFVPLWATVASTGAFIAGGIAGWQGKRRYDKYVDRL